MGEHSQNVRLELLNLHWASTQLVFTAKLEVWVDFCQKALYFPCLADLNYCGKEIEVYWNAKRGADKFLRSPVIATPLWMF